MSESKVAMEIAEFYLKLISTKTLKNRHHIKTELLRNSEYLSSICEELKRIEGLEGSIISKNMALMTTDALTQIKQNIRELEEPFLIFIIGMGKFGKSTLINALLEEKVAEIDILPKTWKIDLYYGTQEEKMAIIIDHNGNQTRMNTEKAKEFLLCEENKRIKSEEAIEKKFIELSKQYKSIEEKEELKNALSNKELYKSPIVEVRWPLKKNKLLENFRLVDTPGLSQSLLGEIRQGLNDYYHKADGVIWLLDASKISANKSRELLDALKNSLNSIGEVPNNIVAVINFKDKIYDKEGQTGVDRVLKEAKEIYGNYFKEIVPISARQAYEAIEKRDDRLYEESGMLLLLDAINRNFYLKSQKVQIESKTKGIKNIWSNHSQVITSHNALIQAENQKRINLIKKNKLQSQDLKSDLTRQAKGKIAQYKTSTEKRILDLAENLFETDCDIKSYIENKIFKTKDFAREIMDLQMAIDERIGSFRQHSLNEVRFTEYKLIGTYNAKQTELIKATNFHTDITQSNVEINGFLASAAAAAIGFFGWIFGESVSFSKIQVGIAKFFKADKVRENLKNTLGGAVYNAESDISKWILNVVDQTCQEIENVCENSFTELYGNSSEINSQQAALNKLTEFEILKVEIPNIQQLIIS